MAEREHFTNGRSLGFATGLTLMLTAFGAQVGNWQHWTSIGIGYGSGVVLMLMTTALFTKSYFAHETQVQAGNRKNDLLTLPQIQALLIAKELRAFIESVGPEPIPKMELSDGTRDDYVSALTSSNNLSREWAMRLTVGFEEKFSKRVSFLRNELLLTGTVLWPTVSPDYSYRQIVELPDLISQAAVGVDYRESKTLSHEQPLLSPLQIEALRLAQDVDLWKETIPHARTPHWMCQVEMLRF